MREVGVRHVRMLKGSITAENFVRVAEIIVDEVDGVIGLQLRQEVWPDEQDPPLAVDGSEPNRLIVYKREHCVLELVINGGVNWQQGGWNVDGFYLVKPGGLHQGVASFGLMQSDEAAVRLNPSIRIVRVDVDELE